MSRTGTNFTVEAVDGYKKLRINRILECDNIPNIREKIPTPEVAAYHSHLRDISHLVPRLDPKAEISLLIGRDVIEAHHVHVLEQRIGPRNAPYAKRLNLGWGIIGENCLRKFQPSSINVKKTHLLP